MSRVTLFHRDLSRRIKSLKQIVESSNGVSILLPPAPTVAVAVATSVSASTACSSGTLPSPQPPPQHTHVGDMYSIDINPNTSQLILRSNRRKTSPNTTVTSTRRSETSTIGSAVLSSNESKGIKSIPQAQRGESLDEGFESDVDTISLVSTESSISLLNLTRTTTRETDSANGSASSDSDDCDGNKAQFSSLEDGSIEKSYVNLDTTYGNPDITYGTHEEMYGNLGNINKNNGTNDKTSGNVCNMGKTNGNADINCGRHDNNLYKHSNMIHKPSTTTLRSGKHLFQSITSEDMETITEYFNLVNCVCYTDSTHPEILILLLSAPNQEEETLIFKFEDSKELETFHENFSTVKAVAAQKTSPFSCKPFNLLQRTDSNGMTHIRISRPDEASGLESSGRTEEDFTSLLSLPSFPTEKEPVQKYEKFATMGKPRKRFLKKSKSIEDLLEIDGDNRTQETGMKKMWSAENLLQIQDHPGKPKVPPRRGRKKGPAPLPPISPADVLSGSSGMQLLELKSDLKEKVKSQSFPNLLPGEKSDNLGLGNVLQGQFVRVQVDQQFRTPQQIPLNFRQKTGPEIIKYENADNWRGKPLKVKNFDAFKFSDPKNLTGYQQQKNLPQDNLGKPGKSFPRHGGPSFPEKKKPKGLSALKLYIPMYKSAKKQQMTPAPVQESQGGIYGPYCPSGYVLGPPGHSQTTGNFTNRLFGMSSKLKEFGSLQSGCNPNKRYDNQAYPSRTSPGSLQGHQPQFEGPRKFINPQNSHCFYNGTANPANPSQESTGRFLGRLGKFGRSGSLGNLTILSQNEKVQSNTLKSVIKKRTKDEDDRKFGRQGKKVTFSAYNTVQVV